MKMNQGKQDSGPISSQDLNKFVDQIDHQVDHLISLVDNMLDVSKVALGKLNIHKKRINFSEFIEELVQSLSDVLERARCKVQTQIESDLFACVDPIRMEQVGTNLLSNAMKYGKGKPILIRLEKSKQELKLLIRDEGIGISKSDQGQIFERFAHANPPNYMSGLGLSLYICKQIVEDHQGTIHVESELGQGASFWVTLPLT
jgi:signal transduction histidine kinase